jgi:hypothetical protein
MMSAKYPRTPHLPWSPGVGNDDRIIESLGVILNSTCVITEKLDGSNLCLTQESVFARSHSGAPKHASFDLAKQFHAEIRSFIDLNESWFFEYCYAVHSIKYEALRHFLNLIGIRNDSMGVWSSWGDVTLTAEVIEIPTVPVLMEIEPIRNIEELQKLTERLAKMPSIYGPQREGIVIRVKESFKDEDFGRSIAKWVRPNHVQTDEHWTNKMIEKQPIR